MEKQFYSSPSGRTDFQIRLIIHRKPSGQDNFFQVFAIAVGEFIAYGMLIASVIKFHQIGIEGLDPLAKTLKQLSVFDLFLDEKLAAFGRKDAIAAIAQFLDDVLFEKIEGPAHS